FSDQNKEDHMATLVLQVAGAALGGAAGGPFGAVLGRALGAFAGSVIDQNLFGSARPIEGPRLSEMAGLASTEGAPIPRVYGRARVGGQLIWATRFEEVAAREKQGGGAFGGKGGMAAPGGAETIRYSYYANIAVGLCEGPIA